ncbi:MAG: ATP-grasp domain-containing protein [Bryobacteraceae bacterium]
MKNEDSADLWMLRTAAGSAPAVSQIEYFRRLGVRTVAADSSPLSIGLFMAERGYCVPLASAPHYIDALVAICERDKVTAFLPALDEELLHVEAATERFAKVGTKVLLSGRTTLELCTDKWAMYQVFSKHGFPTIPTRLGSDAYNCISEAELPQLIKPRHGRGSTGIFVAKTSDELKFFLSYVQDPIVQPFITGSEYTIDVLADWNSEAVVIAPRRRIAAESGISYKGQLAWNEEMVGIVRKMVPALKLIGPVNIQCFIDQRGQLLFSEVNARLAGSSILTAAAGIPLYEGIVDMIRGQSPPMCPPSNQDLVMLRYWAELYVPAAKAGSFGWEA